MSKLSLNNKRQGDLGQVLESINTTMVNRGNEVINSRMSDLMVSMEGNSADDRDLIRSMSKTYDDIIGDAYRAAEISMESLTYAQREAGAVILAAAAKPGAYARAALTMGRLTGGENTALIEGLSGGMDYRPHTALPKASMEAFDDRELLAHIPFSAVFNIQAARQDEFGETFYPTVVVTPDQVGLEISCRRTMVFNDTRHANTGKPTDFGRRHLVEAIVDHTVLESEATLALPIVIPGNTENLAKFALAADVAPYTRLLNGNSALTAPLRPGVSLDLLGLSHDAAVLQTGQLDTTDSLDTRVVLQNLWIKVTNAGADVSVLKFNTEGSPLSQFQKSPEGADRQVNLNYTTIDLSITHETLDAAGAAPAALAWLADPAFPVRQQYVVRLGLDVNGRVNLETGTTLVSNTPIFIDSVWAKDPATGEYSKLAGADLTAVTTELETFELVGYDLLASRSNLNRRSRGLMVSVFEINEKWSIPLGTPIVCPSPVTTTRTAADLAAPIQAARIRNSNNAVTKLLRYADTLRSLHIGSDRSQPVPNIEGLGRLVVRPYFEELEIDLVEVTSSVKSSDRAEDVSAALINAIRDISYRMYRDTAYQAALDAQTGGTGEKPWLYIGTDQYTHRHLIVPGDTRTASIGFEHKVVTSADMRVYGQIFLTFGRPNQAGPDILSFGCMGWMPELATNIQITRNGSTQLETMVQPRTLHVNTLPVLAVIKVKNLDQAIAQQLPLITTVV